MKTLKAMMALSLVLALFVPAAMADQTCTPCYKCSPREIGCPQEQGLNCFYADDYHMTWVNPAELPTAFSRPQSAIQSGVGLYPPCPVIFDICHCDDTSEFVSGTELGFRMKLLVNGAEGDKGVYFNEQFSGYVMLSNDGTFICNPTCQSPAVIATTSTRPDGSYAWFCDANANGLPGSSEPAWRRLAPTVISYYIWSGGGYVEVNGSYAYGNNCDTLAGNEKIVRVVAEDGVELQDVDTDLGMCKLAMDVPGIMVTTGVTACSTIAVQIDVVIDTTDTICSESVAECSCIYSLYTVCCESGGSRLIFPYFTSLGNDMFWNGIAIINLSATAGRATMTAYEQDGSVGTYTTPPITPHGMYVNLLTNIPWQGTGLGNAKCYIEVNTEYTGARGFGMMSSNTHDSMGYIVEEE